MEINELRVGNFIKHTSEDVIGQIAEIHGQEIMFEDWGYGTVPVSECEGIPLTEEWLLKFGFDKKKCVTFDWEDEYVLSIEKYGWEVGVVLKDYPASNPNIGCVSILQSEPLDVPAVPDDLVSKENWTREDMVRAENHKVTLEPWRQPIAYYVSNVHRLQNIIHALTGQELTIKQ